MALKQGSRIFLRFDSPSRGRVLHPGVASEIRDQEWTISFESRHQAVEDGEEKLLYFHQARAFLQQQVVVETQSGEGPPFLLTVKPIGDAVSVGTREEDRVSTLGIGLTAMIEDEPDCPIQDVSLSGLAALSARQHHVGRCLEIAIRYSDEEYVGQVEVQCVHPVGGGKNRYGLLGVFDTAEGKRLQNGLTRMTLEIQQQRLKIISSTS